MTIRAKTIRSISLSQPASPSPRAVPAVDRRSIVPSAMRSALEQAAKPPDNRTGQLIGKALGALSTFAQRVDERKDEINTVKLLTQFEMETAGLPQQALSEVEPNAAPQRYLELHRETEERILEQTDDPDVRLALQTASGKHRAQQFAGLVKQVDVEQRRMLYNEYDARKQLKLRQAAEADSPEERKAFMDEVFLINERIKESNALTPSGEPWTDAEVKLQNRRAEELVNDALATRLISEERLDEAEDVIKNAKLDPKTRAARLRALDTARKRLGREKMDELKDNFDLFLITDGRVGFEGISAAAQGVAAFGDADEVAEASALVEAAEEAQKILPKSLPEQAERIRELRDSADSPDDVVKIRALAELSRRQAQMFSERPLSSAASSVGMELNDMPEEQTPESLRRFFAQRETFASIAEEKQGLGAGSVSPLEPQELGGLKQMLMNIDQDPAAGITMLTSARRNLDPQRYSAIAAKVGADAPALAGGIFVAGTGDFEMAGQIWQGRKIMESDTSFVLPTKAVRSEVMGSVLGDSFDVLEHPNASAAIEQAALARAHVTADMETREIDEDTFRESVEAVIGKRITGNGLVGAGMISLNDFSVPNPVRGAGENFIQNAWENASIADLMNYTIDGVSGRPMMNKGDGTPVELPEAALRKVRLRPRDMVAGFYEVQGTDGIELQDPNGNPYVINLRDLLLETGAASASVGQLDLNADVPDVLF